MPQFHYRAYAKDGSLKTGSLEARDYQTAVDQVYALGLVP